jgi:glucoamylase
LTGERGHYEIAAGRDPSPYLRALENFSQGIGLMPEQIWDGPELPSSYLRSGGTTDAAMPLLWAHSEYVKLHRSAADGKVFDLVEPGYDRYVRRNGERQAIEIWKSNRQVQSVPAGTILRIQANSPFLLHWTSDDWQHSADTTSQGTAIGIEFVDIPVPGKQKGPIRFTFLWFEVDRWEGKDYTVNVVREQEVVANSSENSRRKRKAQRKHAA